jgi:hypothetical protein
MKKKSFITITSLLLLIVFAIGIFILVELKKEEQSKKDDCKEKGGKWDTELNECIPVGRAHPMVIDDFIWSRGFDTTTRRTYLLKGTKLEKYSGSVSTIIDLLNRRNTSCQIEFLEQKGDTVRIKILNDKDLNENMGTTAARCYLGETVVTLTENQDVNYVNIEMNEGSHATHGVYRRSDFKDMILDLDSLITKEMKDKFDSLLVR